MGQRLVVTIHNKGRDIAKIYYHWSAYSVSALKEVDEILNCIYDGEDESESEMLLRLIRFCENNGGGIDGVPAEIAYIKKLYPGEEFKEDVHRSYGLIALSEGGMAQMQYWSEGDITIDLDEERIDNTVYWSYDSIDDYNKQREEWDDDFEPLTLDDVTDIGYDLGDIAVEDLYDVIAELESVDWVCRYGNEIFELIA